MNIEPITVELGEKQTTEDLKEALRSVHCNGTNVSLIPDQDKPKIVTIKGILTRRRAINRLCTTFKVIS